MSEYVTLPWFQSLILGILCLLTSAESFVRQFKFRESTIKAAGAVGYATEAQLQRISGQANLVTVVARIALLFIGVDLIWTAFIAKFLS